MSDPLKMMNDFFRKRPKRTLLDSIDNVFKDRYTDLKVEIVESNQYFMINAELPGIPRESINVEIRGDEVVIEVKEFEHMKRKMGGVHRVRIPEDVTRQRMKALYRNGLLEIKMKKKQPTRIEIE